MLRPQNWVGIGIASVLICSCIGFNAGLAFKDRSEGWISVSRLWLWTWLVPRPPGFALRISSIERQSLPWGPLENSKSRDSELVCTWGRKAPPQPRDTDENGYQHFFMPLRNPGEFRSVAIIEVNSGEVVELNPRRTLHPGKPWQTTYDYGPIPPLSNLTSAQCELLWGSSETIYPGIRTYRLKAFNVPEDADYFLDTTFEFGYLQKYRVRSSETKGKVVLKKTGSSNHN